MHTPLRVLLVDDNVPLRRVMHMFLESPEIEVIGEVGDGSLAVQAVRQLMPDVVLMDYHMPVMDGLAAARLILAGPQPPAILLLSGDIEPDVGAEALRIGVSMVMQKGIALPALRQALLMARNYPLAALQLAA